MCQKVALTVYFYYKMKPVLRFESEAPKTCICLVNTHTHTGIKHAVKNISMQWRGHAQTHAVVYRYWFHVARLVALIQYIQYI